MEDFSDVENLEEWVDSCLTFQSETSSSWYEPDLACIVCAVKAATVGYLCQDCWDWERAIDRMMVDQWQKDHCESPGETKEFPIIISDDDEDA